MKQLASSNPVLENITEYLIEEMSAEEDELLGVSAGDQKIEEEDDKISVVLDSLVLYLRLVHSVDYYKGVVYHNEDEIPNRCGIFHVRESSSPQQTREDDIDAYLEKRVEQTKPLLEVNIVIPLEEAGKLGIKDEDEAIEIFVQANTE